MYGKLLKEQETYGHVRGFETHLKEANDESTLNYMFSIKWLYSLKKRKFSIYDSKPRLKISFTTRHQFLTDDNIRKLEDINGWTWKKEDDEWIETYEYILNLAKKGKEKEFLLHGFDISYKEKSRIKI